MGLPIHAGSFRAYAVDFDGDGHINIWSNPDDAIGSVASYFKRHGWVGANPWWFAPRSAGSGPMKA